MALQTTKFLLHFHFAEIKFHPDAVHWKIQISARNLDTQCPICSFSAEASMNETKLLPWVLRWFYLFAYAPRRAKCIWQIETGVVSRGLEITHAPELNKSEEMFSTKQPQVPTCCSPVASLPLSSLISSYR